MASDDPLIHVMDQVEAASDELDAYAPVGFGWRARAIATVTKLVPWLKREAPGLQSYVEDVLNSPSLLREAWASIKLKIAVHPEVARVDQLLSMESVLLDFVAGDTVSIVVTRHLLARYPGGALAGNSKSDYPDLFLKTNDYSKLPVRKKDNAEIGAALRGKLKKPVRVPDGLEIKTSRDGASIDCHYPHVGLHLMLSFLTKDRKVVVDDVLVAFLRYADYRITKPNTEATTKKASFSRAPFISLLSKT